jgi:stalled ribosome alternative rescue factor ArfA
MLTGILNVLRVPPQCTFWRFLASLHLSVASQLLRVQQILRQRVWQAAHVELKTITLDTDTTVNTLFGHQMGGRKGYNPKNKGKKSYQRMSSEGWCIQWESTPPEQKSEFCSLDSRAGRKLNPGSLSTKPSLGW